MSFEKITLPILCLFFLVYLWSIGFSFLSLLLRNKKSSFESLLLAPAIGLAVLGLELFTVSRLGFAVKDASLSISLFNGFLILFMSFKKNFVQLFRSVPCKWLIPLQLIVFWPLSVFGSRWISYANDDMFNYVLGAQRFLEAGYNEVPNADFFLGKDYSQMFYTLHVIGGVRSGSELVLSYFSSVSGLDPLSIFMALLVCLQTVLVFAMLTFIPQEHREKPWRLSILAIITTFNAVLTFSFVLQLIAQICGLILLISILILSRGFERGSPLSVTLVAVLFAGQFIFYPELIPLLVLALLLVLIFKRKSIVWRPMLNSIRWAFLVCLIALNSQVFPIAKFLLYQIGSGGSSGSNDNFVLFPYFLRVTGFASLFGISPIDVSWSGITAFSTLLLGILCLFVLLMQLLKSRNEIDELSCIVIVLLFIYIALFMRQSDFGTFKMALYASPFFLTFLSIQLLKKANVHNSPLRSKLYIFFFSTFVLLPNLLNQIGYVFTSTGMATERGLIELRNSSKNGLTNGLDSVREQYRPEMGTLVSTTTSPLIAKLTMVKLRDIPVVFPSMDFASNFTGVLFDDQKVSSATFGQKAKSKIPRPKEIPISYPKSRISFPGGGVEADLINYKPHKKQFYLNYRDEINFSPTIHTKDSDVGIFEISQTPSSNLIFTNSELGNLYYMSLQNVALFRPEKHPILQPIVMFAGGKNILFQVFGARKYGTLTLDLDATLLPQNSRKVPSFTVYGQGTWRVDETNYGQARIVLPNVLPFEDELGRQFLYVSFDGEPRKFPERDSSFLRKLNRDIPEDGRQILVHFLGLRFDVDREVELDRDLYLPFNLSEQLSAVSFEGIYSDSWTSSDFYLTLKKREDLDRVKIEFEVLNLDRNISTRFFKVLVNDVVVREKHIKNGIRQISVPMDTDQIRIRVITNPQRVSVADSRISGVRLIRISGD
jgi:hypothetical protein